MSPSRTSFLDASRTDDFTTLSRFSWRDWLGLGVVVLFVGGLAINYFVITNDTFMTLYQFAMPAGLSLLLLCAYGPMLKEHWKLFWTSPGKNVLLVLGLFVGLHLLLIAVRFLFGLFGEGFEYGSLEPRATMFEVQNVTSALPVLLALLASTGPMFVAFVEDTVFRHTLLAKVPVWNRSIALRVLVIAANSFAFGAIHLWAFGGSLMATVPYMVIGLAMNLIYLWTRNLWFVLLTHIVFNSVALLGALLVLVLSPLGAA